ncbi:MAG: hypothetical protein WA919_18800 [Coleofasciculaceae cyanobacterium]
MSGSPLRKYILTPILLSASVFAIFSVPLAIFGSESMTVKVQNEPLFHGQLRHAAPPYLGLVTALSFGTGAICAALTGWGESKRNSAKVEEKLFNLRQEVQEKEAELDELKLSHSKLQVAELRDFFPQEVVWEQSYRQKTVRETIPTLIETAVNKSKKIEHKPVEETSLTTVPATVSQFASAQNFLGHSQTTTNVEDSTKAKSLSPLEVETLSSQLQHVMAQMAALQQAMQCKSLAPSDAKDY